MTLRRLPLPREPFCGYSHLFGAVLSTIGLIALVTLSRGKPWHLTSFAIYGGSLILLYMASTLYHSLRVSPTGQEKLRSFDQVAIYILIAGTYTPICLVSLRGPWGWSLLGVVWGIALVGSIARITWKAKPEWLTISAYFAMGWVCVVAMRPLATALTSVGIGWLFFGGFFYTIGAIILASDRPRLWPGRFGSHDLWHVCVLGGSACHFMVMFQVVALTP